MENELFDCAPILLLGFNRPDNVAGLIRKLASVRPGMVFLAVDGPRNEAEREVCLRTRKTIELIDWPCEVRTFFREENRGCKFAPPEAISWFFSQVEAGIILEDDCYVETDFLRFASELLIRYADDTRIGIISAFSRFEFQSDPRYSYHFSRYANIWGWASWRRVWKFYDVEMTPYLRDFPEIVRKLTPNRRMRKMLTECTRSPVTNTWDTQLEVMIMSNGFLCVEPRYRLVRNIGIAAGPSTHTGAYDFFRDEFMTSRRMPFPLIHPDRIEADTAADEKTFAIFNGILPRGMNYVGLYLPKRLQALMTWCGKVIWKFCPMLFGL